MDQLAIVRRRMREQRLVGVPFEGAAEAVAGLAAMQAQEFEEAKWSISQRTGGLTDAELEQAFSSGEILRTHVLRPTWHFVTPHDIRWLLALTGPRVQRGNAGRYRQLGLDARTLARAHDTIAKELEHGEPRTRRELGEALMRAGIEHEGQRLAHLMLHAELDALIVSGPRRGKQHTYLLLDDRAPPSPARDRDDAVAELVLRFFTSHGPATVRDFVWWSGLTVSDARLGLEAACERLGSWDDGGRTWFVASWSPPEDAVESALMVASFDELTVGYRDLRISARPAPGGGMLPRPVAVGGRGVGVWKRTRTPGQVTVEVESFERLGRRETRALEAEVERFGRFLKLPAALAIAYP